MVRTLLLALTLGLAPAAGASSSWATDADVPVTTLDAARTKLSRGR